MDDASSYTGADVDVLMVLGLQVAHTLLVGDLNGPTRYDAAFDQPDNTTTAVCEQKLPVAVSC